MERYYDMVMANTVAKYAKKEAGLDLPGTGFDQLPEPERWERVKEALSGSRLGVISEWGLIDFDPDEKERTKGAESLSYEEFLDLQKKSGRDLRIDFQKCYYDAVITDFKGQIERINKKKGLLCFERIYICGWYPGAYESFEGKEDHVWMDLDGFGDEYRVGDCMSFCAEVYRYVKSRNGKMIDFGLRNPENIRKIGKYDLPSDEKLRLQEADNMICDVLCMYREHCNGTVCLANPEWRDTMRAMLMQF